MSGLGHARAELPKVSISGAATCGRTRLLALCKSSAANATAVGCVHALCCMKTAAYDMLAESNISASSSGNGDMSQRMKSKIETGIDKTTRICDKAG